MAKSKNKRKQPNKPQPTPKFQKAKKDVVVGDLGERIISAFISRSIIDFDVEKRFYAARLFEDASSGESIEHIVKNSSELDFLTDYLGHAEQQFKHLLEGHSVYDLIYWFRRVPPSNFFGFGLNTSINLWYEIITVAIFKYGSYSSSWSEERCSILFGGGLHPESVCECYLQGRDITPPTIHTLKAIFRSLVVANFYLLCTQDYRVFNKGGTLIAADDYYKYNVVESEEIRHLVNLYDKQGPDSILSGSGVYSKTINKVEGSPFHLMGCMLNVKHQHNIPSEYFEKIGFNTAKHSIDSLKKHLNFIPAPLEIDNIITHLKYFESSIIEKHGFSVDDFVIFNQLISLQFMNSLMSFKPLISVFRRGYTTLSDFESYKQHFKKRADSLGTIYFDGYKGFPVDTVFNFFTSTASKASDIDLWTRGPRTYIYDLGNNLHLIDYYALPNVIKYFGLEFSRLEGKSANFRANEFENKLYQAVMAAGFDVWIHSRVVKFKLAIKKEFDCVFSHNEFLFILEAKSINVSFGYDKGDLESINYRIHELEMALEQAESKADFLVKYSTRLGIPLPAGIKFIVPIVVSAWSEYTWAYNQHFFLDKDFTRPRIISISRINQLSTLDFDYLSQLTYVRKL